MTYRISNRGGTTGIGDGSQVSGCCLPLPVPFQLPHDIITATIVSITLNQHEKTPLVPIFIIQCACGNHNRSRVTTYTHILDIHPYFSHIHHMNLYCI